MCHDTSAGCLPGAPTTGASGQALPSSGFVSLVSLDRNTAREQLALLRSNAWLTPATRAVFLDYLVYSPVLRAVASVTQALPPPLSPAPSSVLPLKGFGASGCACSHPMHVHVAGD